MSLTTRLWHKEAEEVPADQRLIYSAVPNNGETDSIMPGSSPESHHLDGLSSSSPRVDRHISQLDGVDSAVH